MRTLTTRTLNFHAFLSFFHCIRYAMPATAAAEGVSPASPPSSAAADACAFAAFAVLGHRRRCAGVEPAPATRVPVAAVDDDRVRVDATATAAAVPAADSE